MFVCVRVDGDYVWVAYICFFIQQHSNVNILNFVTGHFYSFFLQTSTDSSGLFYTGELWFYILNAIHSWHQNRSKLKILLKKYCELMRKILWSQNFVKKLIHFIYWPVSLIWKIFLDRSAKCKYVYFFQILIINFTCV